MSLAMDIPLAVSLAILVALTGFVVWRFARRRRDREEEVSFKSTERKDKLTLISGIGPTLEKRLNALGITSFKQIARFTDEDIERVNGVMNFKGRIEREKWIIQARKLVEAGSRSRAPRRQTRAQSAAAGAAGVMARKGGGKAGSSLQSKSKARKFLKK